jgi:hypothetical protein
MEKDRKDWTFEELNLHCCKIILEHLLNGSFKTGVYMALQVAVMWHDEQKPQTELDKRRNSR